MEAAEPRSHTLREPQRRSNRRKPGGEPAGLRISPAVSTSLSSQGAGRGQGGGGAKISSATLLDAAVINFRLTGHEQFTDADIISELRQTETYVKQNGSWLLVARQWGKLPVNFRKPVAVDTSVYKDYVALRGERAHNPRTGESSLQRGLDGDRDVLRNAQDPSQAALATAKR